MNKSEAKFYNTALKMHSALFTLLNEKEFIDISIIEICKLADVNRSTFYAHYKNTYELLQDANKELTSKFFSSFTKEKLDVALEQNADTYFITEKYLVPYLKFFKKNRKFYKVYIQNISLFKTEDMYDYLINKVIHPMLIKYNINDKKVANYIGKYYLTGINAIVHEWICNNCLDDIMLICEIIEMCIKKPKEL